MTAIPTTFHIYSSPSYLQIAKNQWNRILKEDDEGCHVSIEGADRWHEWEENDRKRVLINAQNQLQRPQRGYSEKTGLHILVLETIRDSVIVQAKSWVDTKFQFNKWKPIPNCNPDEMARATWIEHPYTVKQGYGPELRQADVWVQDISLGLIEQSYGSGWTSWQWKSYSALGDQIHVKPNNDFGTIDRNVRNEIKGLCIGQRVIDAGWYDTPDLDNAFDQLNKLLNKVTGVRL